MTADRSRQRNRLLLFIFATVVGLLAVYLFYHFKDFLSTSLTPMLGAQAAKDSLRIPELILLSLLAFLGVRAVSTLIFDLLFRFRRGYEAPTLVRNIFSLISFTVLFVLIFNRIYKEVDLGALFTTSAIFGVIFSETLSASRTASRTT